MAYIPRNHLHDGWTYCCCELINHSTSNLRALCHIGIMNLRIETIDGIHHLTYTMAERNFSF